MYGPPNVEAEKKSEKRNRRRLGVPFFAPPPAQTTAMIPVLFRRRRRCCGSWSLVRIKEEEDRNLSAAALFLPLPVRLLLAHTQSVQ